jgi:hypothetical protein
MLFVFYKEYQLCKLNRYLFSNVNIIILKAFENFLIMVIFLLVFFYIKTLIL